MKKISGRSVFRYKNQYFVHAIIQNQTGIDDSKFAVWESCKSEICRMILENYEQGGLERIGMDEKKERLQQKYNEYVKEVTPTHNLWWNMAKAFVTGGIICCIGQFILNTAMNYGLDRDTAGSWCSLLLILLSVLLTGFNIYPSIANWGGAGALVPITGFANGVAAPAIEFQKEGQVFGIGCKIFTIAGPVILYGIFSSWMLGLIYWGLKILGMV